MTVVGFIPLYIFAKAHTIEQSWKILFYKSYILITKEKDGIFYFFFDAVSILYNPVCLPIPPYLTFHV